MLLTVIHRRLPDRGTAARRQRRLARASRRPGRPPDGQGAGAVLGRLEPPAEGIRPADAGLTETTECEVRPVIDGRAETAIVTTEERRAMTTAHDGTREEWLAARLGLLEEEKELTRRSDELARLRQELPWVRIDKAYRFDTDEGSASLADLFRRRSQLLVYHFMFGPDYKAGCPSCSIDRGWVQRLRRPPREPRRHAVGGVARAACEAAGLQAADGLDVSLGVLVRRRLQLRFQCLVHRGSSSATEASNTTTGVATTR